MRFHSISIPKMWHKVLLLMLCLSLLPISNSLFTTKAEESEAPMFVGTLSELAQHELLQGAVAFSLDEPLALANGAIGQIDSADSSVTAWLDTEHNRAYAPLRFITQAYQAELEWDSLTQSAVMVLDGRTVKLTVDSLTMKVDGTEVTLDAAPRLVAGRVYLPLRAVALALDLEIYFENGLVILQSEPNLKKLRDEGENLLSLLSLKLKPLARINSYENLVLLLESSFGRPGYYYDLVEEEAVFEMADGDSSGNRNVFTNSAPTAMPQAEATTSARLSSPTEAGASMDNSDTSSNSTAEEKNFSETNTQVAGVDEADIIKTDGEYIYVVRGNQALIVKATPAEAMQVVARIPYTTLQPQELYIEENRLVVIGQAWRDDPRPLAAGEAAQGVLNTSPNRRGIDYYINPSVNQVTRMLVYDIQDRANPKISRSLEVEGNYVSSRRIGSCYYLVTNRSIDWYSYGVNADGRYSAYYDKEIAAQPFYGDSLQGETAIGLPYNMIRCFPEVQEANYLMVAAFDAAKEEPLDVQAYLGAGSTLYVSAQNLYVAMNQQQQVARDEASSRQPYRYGGYYEMGTRIFSFALNQGKVQYQATGAVPGTLLNQFSMDEYHGYLRLATNKQAQWWLNSIEEMRNQLYVLDGNLDIVGRIEDIAPGERIYSARFMGDRAFMVTFRTVDPLFVIDLKDPVAPKILGELKIPGYSDYLHPVGENYLLGFGKDAVAVPIKDAQGRILDENAYYLGMKLSLFDVSDLSDPKEIAMMVFGDRGTESSLLHNHKALMFNSTTGLLAFPLYECQILNGAYFSASGHPHYGTAVFDGLVILKVDPEAGEEALQELGRITQQRNKVDASRGLQVDYLRTIDRGLYIDRTIYTLSPSVLQANSMDDYSYLGSVSLH